MRARGPPASKRRRITIFPRSFLAVAAATARTSQLQPAGRVLFISDPRHRTDLLGNLRIAAGETRPMRSATSYVLFSPRDPRFPFVRVERHRLPEEVIANPAKAAEKLWSLALDDEWPRTSQSPSGQVRASIGQAGEIATETAALLRENGCDHGAFPSAVLAEIAQVAGDGWKIPEEEYAARRDYRKARIFSIDPTTAKDLDDALHITPVTLDDGSPGFEVGGKFS